MSGPVLPSVRLPAVAPVEGREGDSGSKEVPIVDLPPANKFGIAWPPDVQPTDITMFTARPADFSSSDTDTDTSEDPLGAGTHAAEGFPSESEHTPTNKMDADHDPIGSSFASISLPRLSRAFSMPVSSQLGHLKNPRRVPSESSDHIPSPVIQLSSDLSHFQELSLELADSVQLVAQTLLQLSPPQVLDPAKEQFSACSISIPTPCISAMFTSVKNLNYMSANMATFSSLPLSSNGVLSRLGGMSMSEEFKAVESDFDIAEMLQSVGDAISGLAAEAGVDVVLYHGDVGLKHISVRADECGVSYTLTHILRQIIATAKRGDSVEIGLFISSATGESELSSGIEGLPELANAGDVLQGKLKCTFDIAHKFHSDSKRTEAAVEYLPSRPGTPMDRPAPNFGTVVLRSLLHHLDASFTSDLPPKLFLTGRSCELVLTLDPGDPAVVNPSVVVPSEEARSAAYPNVRIANEPTLQELTQFAETLRGKKVTLYASSKGSFAHHLTSYLTAWGLDVSHISNETGEGIPEVDEANEVATSSPIAAPTVIYGNHNVMTPPLGLGVEGLTPQLQPVDPKISTSPTTSTISSSGLPLSFIFIDDNVEVLRERLRKLRSEHTYGANMHTTRKRPSLAANHRPRSSPQVARALGIPPQSNAFNNSTVIVHFTSLSNYKLVKDVMQSVLTPSSAHRMPEVIVIPKPAGPRRFLTALHTAVTKPIVDPFFAPIATSPMSPGLHSQLPFFHSANQSPGSPGQRPPIGTASRQGTGSDKSTRSPKEVIGDPIANLPLPSPLSMSDGMEYFADAAVKLGGSPSTGLVIQSPDGQPAGILFHPRGTKVTKSSPVGASVSAQSGLPVTEPRVRRGARRTSDPYAGPQLGTPNSGIGNSVRRAVAVGEEGAALAGGGSTVRKRGKTLGPNEDAPPTIVTQPLPTPADPIVSPALRPTTTIQRKSSQATPPLSPRTDVSGGTPPPVTRGPRRRGTKLTATPPTPSAAPPKKGKPAPDSNIIPPISVLVVDDNPINQTILSTFMRKKKIKYDVAKNGEEAVTKWRSGGFHLILMDIQMPVMDGIQATKEIRRLEKSYGSAGPATPISDLEQRTPSDIVSTDSKNPATPYRSSVIIVALTASSLQSDRVAALAAGCNDFLTKPVSLQWLNNKIIEWGSIKALQMWADLRPEVVKSISSGQVAQAQNVARKLHVPEGRATPNAQSRSSSLTRKHPLGPSNGGPVGELSERSSASPPVAPKRQEIIAEALPPRAAAALLAQTPTSETGSEAVTPIASFIPQLQLTEATPSEEPKVATEGTYGAQLGDLVPAAATGESVATARGGPLETTPVPGLAETATLPTLLPPSTPPEPLKAELPAVDSSLSINTPEPGATPTTEATLTPGKTDTSASTKVSSPSCEGVDPTQIMPEKVQDIFEATEAEERGDPGVEGGASD